MLNQEVGGLPGVFFLHLVSPFSWLVLLVCLKVISLPLFFHIGVEITYFDSFTYSGAAKDRIQFA